MTKAYDKAWLQAIIYAMHKSGITGELLRLVKKINENLTAIIETKHGVTRKIQIKDSIRQGGVLAVVAYANLMDEIAKEIKENKENLITIGNNEKPGCLLWMDDVVLLHTDKKQMQEMLNTTHEIASRYRIKFGAAKSKVLVIGKDKAEFKIGNQPIEEATTYKYLGNTINNKGTMQDHILTVKGKCEATTQTILSIAKHKHLREKDMMTMMQLHDACTVPTLLYGSEGWILTKEETEKIEAINNNILKRFLKTPKTTSKELIYMETGSTPISSMIDTRQILYHKKKPNLDNHHTDPRKDPWDTQVKKAIDKYEIVPDNLVGSITQAKKVVKSKIDIYQHNEILKISSTKSKVKHLIDNGSYKKDINRQHTYITECNRNECAAIFATRTRMLGVKNNYRSAHMDLTCRWCKDKPETQDHILKDCPSFTDHTQQIDMSEIMNPQRSVKKPEATIVSNIYKKINGGP